MGDVNVMNDLDGREPNIHQFDIKDLPTARTMGNMQVLHVPPKPSEPAFTDACWIMWEDLLGRPRALLWDRPVGMVRSFMAQPEKDRRPMKFRLVPMADMDGLNVYLACEREVCCGRG